MPRIQASSVAEQREQRQRAILDAARNLLIETSEAPSMGEVGKRAGLSRSGVYQYFESVDALLAAVSTEVFPAWMTAVGNRVEAAETPGTKVWAYVQANFESFANPDLAVTAVLARVIAPESLPTSVMEFHRRLQIPLVDALRELGEPDPESMAGLIDSLILRATHPQGVVKAGDDVAARAQSLSVLRRLLGPYLGLQPTDRD